MTISHSYERSVNAWRTFLEKTTDTPNGVKWDQNIQYFKDIVGYLLDDNFERESLGKSMYQHPLAGFYRWNILDGVSGNFEFEAKFHVFPELSRTHIHSHGYEGKSFILDGSLQVHNFNPNEIGEILGEFLKVLKTDALRQVGHIAFPIYQGGSGVGKSTSEYLQQLGKHDSDELSFLSQRYGIQNIAAFESLQSQIQDNPVIISQIENDLFRILTGESHEYGYYTGLFVHAVLGLSSILDFSKYFLHQNGRLYQLEQSETFRVSAGNQHIVGVNQAHSVEVLKPDTATLFMTRKSKNVRTLQEGGEFHIFSPQSEEQIRYTSSIEDAREYIFGKLKKIYIK